MRPGAAPAWAMAALFLALAAAEIAHAADCRDGPGNWRAGSAIYHKTCVRCHGADGHGTRRGMPDLTAGVMAYSSSSLAAHIEHGFRGPGRPLAMPPKGGYPDLTADDISDVIAFLHHAFGCG
jgi:mono/diheme cytochrome c family protein